jgi:hypothetical protein
MTKFIKARGFRKTSLTILAAAALTLLSPIFSMNHTRASAQDNSKSTTRDRVAVIAQLPLPGSAVRQIFMQEEKGKQYLLIQQNVHFTVVDVTNPKKPQIVERVGSEGKLTDVGAGLVIAVQSDHSGQAPVSAQTVRLVNMSDPKNPHTVKTLTGVTSVYSEDGRKLIYLTNNQGLWIVKHYETYSLPFCSSDSYSDPVAQCQ